MRHRTEEVDVQEAHDVPRAEPHEKSCPQNAPLVDRAATASDLVDAAAATREVARRNAMVPIILDQTSDRICGFGGTSLCSNRMNESSESRKNKTRRRAQDGRVLGGWMDLLLGRDAGLEGRMASELGRFVLWHDSCVMGAISTR